MKEIRSNKWSILSAVLIGTIMGPIDGSVTNVAMPQLAKIFNTDITTISWVAMTYLLMISSFMLTFGRLGDILGYKKLYQYGLVTFSLTSAILSMSNNIHMLIIVRAFQAIGAGMLMSMAPAIITATFPSNERGKALGFNAMAVSIGLSIGPILGGFLLTYLGWRSIFYINIPIGIIGYIWAQIVVPQNKGIPEKFDLLGSFIAFVFLVSLLLFISEGGTWGWKSNLSMISLITSIVFFILFIIVEKKIKYPMLDLSLFKIKIFTFGNISTLINFMAQFTMTFLTPFLLQQIGYSTDMTGLILTAFPLVMLFSAPISGILSDKYGAQILSTAGALITAVSLFLMATLNMHSSTFSIIWRLGLFGIGNGIFQTPNNSSVMGSVTKKRLGIASAFLATMRNTGMVLGIAIGAAIFTNRMLAYEAMKIAKSSAFMLGLRDAFIVAGILSVICALTSLVRDNISINDTYERS